MGHVCAFVKSFEHKSRHRRSHHAGESPLNLGGWPALGRIQLAARQSPISGNEGD
jgi:hypothetical protein